VKKKIIGIIRTDDFICALKSGSLLNAWNQISERKKILKMKNHNKEVY